MEIIAIHSIDRPMPLLVKPVVELGQLLRRQRLVDSRGIRRVGLLPRLHVLGPVLLVPRRHDCLPLRQSALSPAFGNPGPTILPERPTKTIQATRLCLPLPGRDPMLGVNLVDALPDDQAA